jgi:hypothetical protein
MRLPFAVLLSLVIPIGSCRFGVQKNTILTPDAIEKIAVVRDQVYDLSGYAGNGGGNPFNLFDENALVDPRYEKSPDSFIPVTNCQPTLHPAIYFNKKRGSRIVIDLKIPYRLKEIYLYDRSETADSCWLYTGELKNWRTLASFTTVSRPDSWGWKKISLSEQTQHLMIRFASYETRITEMVLYGSPIEKLPPAENVTPSPGMTRVPLSQFLGVNYIMEKEASWLMPFHYSRLYNFALDYDNDSTRDENRVRFNMLHYGRYDSQKGKYIFDIDTLQRINQGDLWFSIRGVARWMNDLGFSDKDRPLNHPFMDSEDPKSYSRHAEMMWNLSAFFGYHSVDSNQLSLSHEPRQSGRGSMHMYENGNEEDATWVGDKYCSPTEYFAQSTADFDGDEGRLGNRYGVHAADSTALLVMSGLIDLDTNRVKVYQLLCKNLRGDKQFIWQGGIEYHYYAQKKGRGISPEQDSLRWRLARVASCTHQIAPGVKCILGENGYDKSQTSWQATPLIPGLSPAQSQAIMLVRSINATFFSGFDAYILYWLRDGNPENDPRVFLTSGILRTLPDGKTMVYPGWYYISTMIRRLGKYRPEQVIQENGDLWIYKYKNTEHPDSVAFFMYKPTVDGSPNVLFSFGHDQISGSTLLKVDFTDHSDEGKEETIPVFGENTRISIGERPSIIFFREHMGGK